jgi:protein-S-isoprenylcysteine O-methyltransferase Ste14
MQTADRAPAGARAVAWTGTLFFFASLAYFLFSYVMIFGRPVPAGPRAYAVAIDVTLFTVFAMHHSVFARERVRAAVSRLVPPALERSFYVWIASALFTAVIALWQPVPGVAWQAEGALRWLLLALQAAGVWITLRSAMIIDVLELSGVRQLSPEKGASEFKTSGPYGWMRHPIYTGWFLMVFCAPAMTMTRLVFAAVSCLYLLIAIPFEERSLLATSAGAYERYARQVPWKLLPGLY